jgi:predicted outer membrane repeat protein
VGDEIRVAAGTYAGVQQRDGVTQAVYISKTVTIGGGYAVSNWATSDPVANLTALDAQGQGRVLYITGTVSPTIVGLWIMDGNAGGNSRNQDGGGVYIDGGSVALSRVQIISNTAKQHGGGVYVNSGSVTLSSAQITSNTAEKNGGGVFLAGSGDSSIVNTILARNTCASNKDGAELYLNTSGHVVLLHVTLADVSLNPKQAIYVNGGTVGITNTIIVNHTTGIEQLGGTVFEAYSLFFGNSQDYVGTIVHGDHDLFNQPPAFVDPANGDYHIRVGSPAIDAGVDAGVTTDIDGQPRPAGSGFDLGADEWQGSTVAVGPAQGGILNYTSPQGTIVMLDIPPRVVTQTTTIAYSALDPASSPPPPSRLRFAGDLFELDALEENRPVPNFSFQSVGVTLTIHYSDADVAGIDESTLVLYRFVAPEWQIVGARPPETQTLDIDNNVLTARLMGFSRFRGMGVGYDIFLPVVIRGE